LGACSVIQLKLINTAVKKLFLVWTGLAIMRQKINKTDTIASAIA